MQPFDFLGVPGPDDCLGMAGVLVSIVLIIAGGATVGVTGGSISAFGSIAVGGVLAWSSIAYCLAWGPLGDNSVTD
ncbi:hypothetical protein [Halovenus salina]|uniref:Uncharacterized protein n=1 Tax=Halovenus salina TaxID=1510225 RepID=A0ABD5W3H5_9EURY